MAAKLSISTLWTLHDLTWWKEPKQSSLLGRSYYRALADEVLKSAHVVTPSDSIRHEAMEFFHLEEHRVTSIPNGISERFIHTNQKEPPQNKKNRTVRPYFLFVGTVEPRKNLIRTLQAFKLSGLAGTHDLWLVGRQGWGEVPEGAEVKGVFNDDQLVEAYQNATATVLFSLDEGFGLPVIESLACETPVVVSRIPVFEDMKKQLTDQRARDADFLLADPLSIDEMANAMKDVATHDDLVDPKTSDWARGFTWQRSGDAHLDLYRKLSTKN
jgi:glycosyltransferase involved in cell wall biosynthesis